MFGSSEMSFISNHNQGCSEGNLCWPELGTACLRSELENPGGVNSKAGSSGRQEQGEGAEPAPRCPEAGQSLLCLCRDTMAVGDLGQHSPAPAAPDTIQDSAPSPCSPRCLLLTLGMQTLSGTPEQHRNQAGPWTQPERLSETICHQDREQGIAEHREAGSVPMELSAQEVQSRWKPS